MRGALRILIIIAIAAAVILAILALRPRANPSPVVVVVTAGSSGSSLHPVDYAKAAITGGIGAMMTVDSATGLPKVVQVLAGSPADKAGLRAGDLVLRINGEPTTPHNLKEAVARLHGLTASLVTLTVQPPGSTNAVDVMVRRSSWNALGIQPARAP